MDVFACLLLAHEIECFIDPVHLLREDPRIRLVDEASKTKDTDNWSIDHATFTEFDADFHFEVNLFADKFNKKVGRSLFYDPAAWAVDAFSIRWNLMCWVCPPISLLPRVIRRIRHSECQGLLLVPNWPASDYYPYFFPPKGLVCLPFSL